MVANLLVAVVTILYVGAAISYLLQHQMASAIIFGAYALANIGILMQTGAFK